MLRYSQSDEPNPEVIDRTETYAGKDNMAFFADAARELGEGEGFGHGGRGLIGLVGTCDLPGVALRRAQSILRWDRRPSLWSHAFLVVEPLDASGDAAIREVTLHSREGRFPEPANNAVTRAKLSDYRDAARDQNIALLAVMMSDEEVDAVVERAVGNPNRERLRYDLFETLGFWMGYLWVRGTPNPLEQGIPMFSSALIEYCFEAIRLDLTPGANDRNSAPEHLWNSARWWQDAFTEFNHPLHGRYVLRDQHCQVLGPEEM